MTARRAMTDAAPVQPSQSGQLNGGGGLSLRAIARICGVSKSTVHRDIAASRNEQRRDDDGRIVVGLVGGQDGKVRPNRRLDAEELAVRDQCIHALRDEGKSIRAIAAAVGVSVGTVHRVLRAAFG